MRKRPAPALSRAITFDQITGAKRVSSGPPGNHESLLDRLFTGLGQATGLTRIARLRLVRQIEQTDREVTARLQQLHQMLNTVVDGGWMGLWTSMRVCAGAV